MTERRRLRRAFYYIRKYTASKPIHKYTIHVPVPIQTNAHKDTHTANMFGHQQIFKDSQLHLATLTTNQLSFVSFPFRLHYSFFSFYHKILFYKNKIHLLLCLCAIFVCLVWFRLWLVLLFSLLVFAVCISKLSYFL